MSRDNIKQAVNELVEAIDNDESIEKCYQHIKTIENCLWAEKEERLAAAIAASRVQ